MTKKHFKVIADYLAKMRDTDCKLNHRELVQFLGGIFEEINNKFDWERWNDACFGKPYKK